MKMNPQDVVAIILAIVVVIFVAGGIIRAVLNVGGQPSEVLINMWSDLIKVLLGGLIGYMSAKSTN